MKPRLILLIVCSLLLLEGCKKSSTDTTQSATFKPLSYLPVYPGSYWKYLLGNDTVVSMTWDTMVHFTGTMLPVLDGWPVSGYQKFTGIMYVGWVKILSEKVGDVFGEYFNDPRYYPGHKVTKVLQKTKDTHGDSIIIQRSITYSPGPNPVPLQQWVYQIYKKEVGLYFECGIDSVTKDTTYKKILVKYFINRSWHP